MSPELRVPLDTNGTNNINGGNNNNGGDGTVPIKSASVMPRVKTRPLLRPSGEKISKRDLYEQLVALQKTVVNLGACVSKERKEKEELHHEFLAYRSAESTGPCTETHALELGTSYTAAAVPVVSILETQQNDTADASDGTTVAPAIPLETLPPLVTSTDVHAPMQPLPLELTVVRVQAQTEATAAQQQSPFSAESDFTATSLFHTDDVASPVLPDPTLFDTDATFHHQEPHSPDMELEDVPCEGQGLLGFDIDDLESFLKEEEEVIDNVPTLSPPPSESVPAFAPSATTDIDADVRAPAREEVSVVPLHAPNKRPISTAEDDREIRKIAENFVHAAISPPKKQRTSGGGGGSMKGWFANR